MNKIILAILVFGFLHFRAQTTLSNQGFDIPLKDTLKHYEIGYLFFGVNTRNELRFKDVYSPAYDFLSGILLRYKFNRLSLRVSALYSEKTSGDDGRTDADGMTGNVKTRDFKTGAGLQFTPFKKKELFYAYMDICYRHLNETGIVAAYKNFLYTAYWSSRKTTGVDLVPGVGTKLKLFRNIYASLEGSYDYLRADTQQTLKNAGTQETFHQTIPVSFHKLTGRLYLSVVF